MPSAHPFKKLHGLTRQSYTGGIYHGREVSSFVGNDRFGAMYPFMMASPQRPFGRKAPAGPGPGIDHTGYGA